MTRNLLSRLVPVALLAVLALLTWWFKNITEQPVLRQEAELRHEADTYMQEFTVTSMNETGNPRYRLRAELMEHFPDDDTTELTRPRMTVFEDDVAPWTIDSEKGTATSQAREILLSGGVLIQREATAAQSAISLNTQDLLVRPDQRYAETDKPVTVQDAVGITRAVGLRVFMKEQRLELLSQVRGHYDAP